MSTVTSKVLSLVATFSLASSAIAVTVTPSDTSWGNPAGENSGGGSSSITGTAPHSGTGSVEMFGDRTRFVGLGNFYDKNSNLGLLKDLTGFTFDWNIAVGSTSALSPDYTPALRLHIWDGNQRSELIWEGAYNGTYGNTTKGTWYTTGVNDNFWQFQTGIGATLVYDRDITDWQSIYSSGAYIAGISIGVGSSAGAGYHAFADNVTLAFGANSTTYNFEVASVPDAGSSFALFGTALAGLALFRRRLAA